jgi:hypothetical protein
MESERLKQEIDNLGSEFSDSGIVKTILNNRIEQEKETDIEKFVALYREFGIECLVNRGNDYQFILMCRQKDAGGDDILTTSSGKFDGYSYFFTKIIFDKSGKFIQQGFWE